jgi:hypothetical protein
MLVIVIKRLGEVGKTPCPKHPGIGYRIVLIKNILRKNGTAALSFRKKNLPAIDLDDQTSCIQNQAGIFVMI